MSYEDQSLRVIQSAWKRKDMGSDDPGHFETQSVIIWPETVVAIESHRQ